MHEVQNNGHQLFPESRYDQKKHFFLLRHIINRADNPESFAVTKSKSPFFSPEVLIPEHPLMNRTIRKNKNG
jgi:hypothetical protein